MAKLFTMFIILIALQASMLIYHTSEAAPTSIWQFVVNPTMWAGTDWIIAFAGVATLLGAIGIVGGTVFGIKTDTVIFAPLVFGLMTMGAIFVKLYDLIQSELVARVFGGGLGLVPSMFISGIIVGPWALYYVWSVIEWWRGKDN